MLLQVYSIYYGLLASATLSSAMQSSHVCLAIVFHTHIHSKPLCSVFVRLSLVLLICRMISTLVRTDPVCSQVSSSSCYTFIFSSVVCSFLICFRLIHCCVVSFPRVGCNLCLLYRSPLLLYPCGKAQERVSAVVKIAYVGEEYARTWSVMGVKGSDKNSLKGERK